MVTQAVGYAACALGYVAMAGGRALLVREVAEACGIPAPYLAKIVNTLRRIGMVETQRGIGGGVTLARPAAEITLLDLCRAMGDPIAQQRCMLGNADCSNERNCPAHCFWSEQRERIMDFLSRTTIADFAAFEAQRRQPPAPPQEGSTAA